MSTLKMLGWMSVCVLLVSGMALAGDPGTEERPVVQEKAIEAIPPATAPAPEAAAPQPEEPAQPPVPVVDEAQPDQPKCTVTCYRPVWKSREVTCSRPVCRYREEVRTCKTPVYTQEQRTRTVICWKTECVTEMRTVTTCQNVVDECGRCCPQMVTCEVPVNVAKQVPYEVEQPYTVCVCNWEEKEYTVQVPYWDHEEFTCTQQYCEMEPYEVEVNPAPCCRPCAPVCVAPMAVSCGSCN